MPQFKEAFHTRIEVIKTLEGSKIEVFTWAIDPTHQLFDRIYLGLNFG
jgi:hypothetical protein